METALVITVIISIFILGVIVAAYKVGINKGLEWNAQRDKDVYFWNEGKRIMGRTTEGKIKRLGRGRTEEDVKYIVKRLNEVN